MAKIEELIWKGAILAGILMSPKIIVDKRYFRRDYIQAPMLTEAPYSKLVERENYRVTSLFGETRRKFRQGGRGYVYHHECVDLALEGWQNLLSSNYFLFSTVKFIYSTFLIPILGQIFGKMDTNDFDYLMELQRRTASIVAQERELELKTALMDLIADMLTRKRKKIHIEEVVTEAELSLNMDEQTTLRLIEELKQEGFLKDYGEGFIGLGY